MSRYGIYNRSAMVFAILKYKPAKSNVTFDADGWVDINELLERVREIECKKTSLESLKDSVRPQDNKQDIFDINDDFTKIRVTENPNVKFFLNEGKPNDRLYCGIPKKALRFVKTDRVTPKRKDIYVNLFNSRDVAIKIGYGHVKYAILEIDSKKMYADGYKFYISKNDVWLTEFIPYKYIIRN